MANNLVYVLNEYPMSEHPRVAESSFGLFCLQKGNVKSMFLELDQDVEGLVAKIVDLCPEGWQFSFKRPEGFPEALIRDGDVVQYEELTHPQKMHFLEALYKRLPKGNSVAYHVE